jgi:hypothetical protein
MISQRILDLRVEYEDWLEFTSILGVYNED